MQQITYAMWYRAVPSLIIYSHCYCIAIWIRSYAHWPICLLSGSWDAARLCNR